MKLKVVSVFSLLLFTLVACTPAKAGERTAVDKAEQMNTVDSVAGTPATELAALGFYVFPEPIQLPEFSVPSLTGEMISSSEFSGKVTLLNFWATWCPPCRKEMPSIDRLHAAMQGTDFAIVAISVSEKKDTVEKFITTEGYSFPVYLDEKGSIGAALASQGIPTTYILNKDGFVIAGIVGSFEYDSEKLITLLQEMAQ